MSTPFSKPRRAALLRYSPLSVSFPLRSTEGDRDFSSYWRAYGAMRTPVRLLLFCLLICASCIGQSSLAKWQVATPMQVKLHSPEARKEAATLGYDVTVRVGNVEYVVLYVPPNAASTSKAVVESCLGIDRLVLVGADTIKYNDMLGRTHEVPIISRRTIVAKYGDKCAKQ